MSYKSVLVHVGPTAQHQDRLTCAAALADRFGATLVGLGSEAIPPAPVADPWGLTDAGWFVAMSEQLEVDLKAAKAQFEVLTFSGPRQWRVGRGLPSVVLASCAAIADLIVTGHAQTDKVSRFTEADIGDLIIAAGRPVLVVPPKSHRLDASSIVIAWKNSREARRAVGDALPLLKSAKDVVLLSVTSTEDREDACALAEDVAENLKRHDVPVRTAWESDANDQTFEIVQSRARAMGSDLIVAGGYGHSRLGEWVFGGVTKRLIDQTERFVFFSH